MSHKVKFKIDCLPKTRNSIAEKRWIRHAEKKKWLDLVNLATRGQLPENPIKLAQIRLVRHSTICPDYDGLVSSFKYVIDALVKLEILLDDNMKVLPKPCYAWSRAPKNEGFITVEVTECSSTDWIQP